jgi:hypothetical protein
LSKSCQKVVKKISKSSQKIVKKLLKILSHLGKKTKMNRPENKNKKKKKKKKKKEEEEDNWYSLDQVPTTSHLVKIGADSYCAGIRAPIRMQNST